VQFTLDDGLDGNHIITCPKCGHEHYRVIKNGEVTGERYSPYNGATFYASTITYTAISSEMTYASSSTDTNSSFLYGSWASTGTAMGWTSTAGG
jgi:hypothetical protein